MKNLITTFALIVALTAITTAKIIGTVNGYSITEKEANNLLEFLTDGKVKYSMLKPKDKKEIVRKLAVDKLVVKAAYKSFSKKERDFIISNAYIAEKIRNIKVSTKEAKKAYNKNRELFKKNGKIIPFSKVKKIIKIQLKQKKVANKMIKKAKIVFK